MACRQGRRKRAKIDHNEVAVAHVTKGVDQDGLRKYYINKEIAIVLLANHRRSLDDFYDDRHKYWNLIGLVAIVVMTKS
ncbi:uncharacterized protein LOC130647694 isoform X2 [Hydractinia symbiolongicarpus]|uniref:uncharacterized protein LOC130647694 isoform X2 n=1 Tax=Hydractinia symbiolongicarpus TaxID=13093 RepID=UPI0025519D98|nr:uncharacterized protein LOC130647694 isoform X2 [Hydractinia symbiolongicarpus]